MSDQINFDQFDQTEKPLKNKLIIDLDGFEGPLDILLELARDQKVDLLQISILHLADQYLNWVAEARKKNLELAADYLVMAAWLAYLKSRLLLPDQPDEEEPSAEEMASALAFQLKRLEAMRLASEKLMDLSTLGLKSFKRGETEKFATEEKVIFDVSLYELMKCYGDIMNNQKSQSLQIEVMDLYSMDMAIERLRKFLGKIPQWTKLGAFLPHELKNELHTRSAVASTFAAALEMARDGKLNIRQSETFGPIFFQSDPKKEHNDPN